VSIDDPEFDPPPAFGDGARRTSEIALISQHMASLMLDVRELRKEIRDIRSPNWQILLGFAALLLTAGVGLWTLAISPIREELAKFPSQFAQKDIVEERFAEAAKERVQLAERFNNYATKDQLNQVIIDVDRRLPRK
jgi:hypothetical protein